MGELRSFTANNSGVSSYTVNFPPKSVMGPNNYILIRHAAINAYFAVSGGYAYLNAIDYPALAGYILYSKYLGGQPCNVKLRDLPLPPGVLMNFVYEGTNAGDASQFTVVYEIQEMADRPYAVPSGGPLRELPDLVPYV